MWQALNPGPNKTCEQRFHTAHGDPTHIVTVEYKQDFKMMRNVHKKCAYLIILSHYHTKRTWSETICAPVNVVRPQTMAQQDMWTAFPHRAGWFCSHSDRRIQTRVQNDEKCAYVIILSHLHTKRTWLEAICMPRNVASLETRVQQDMWTVFAHR